MPKAAGGTDGFYGLDANATFMMGVYDWHGMDGDDITNGRHHQRTTQLWVTAHVLIKVYAYERMGALSWDSVLQSQREKDLLCVREAHTPFQTQCSRVPPLSASRPRVQARLYV
jgi:hypothetical protein